MPGVYRDVDGTYRYFSINDYEDRRRRDMDDRRAGRTPFGPRTPPPLAPPPRGLSFAPLPAPQVGADPVTFDFDEFARSVNAAYQPPDASGILAVLNGEDAPDDHAWFDRLLQSLPERAGQNPAFDALITDSGTTVLTTQQVIAQINA
jgi:hypothetical protein